MIASFIKSKIFNNTILIAIIINSIVLAFETIPNLSATMFRVLHWIDFICIGLFVIEALLKLITLKQHYFKSAWNCFDFIVVLLAVLPFNQMFSIFRALRIIRAFKLIEHVPALKRVIAALTLSIPGMLSTAALLLLVFFVFGVLTTQLYSASFPQWFGHIGRSMFSLFQIMTLESWSMGIVRPIMQVYSYAWCIFVPFILLSAFILLNFLIGIVVDAIAHLKSNETKDNEFQQLNARLDKIEVLLSKLTNDSNVNTP
jgi:voltage-gated sodium channel